nr:PREDICTED: extracellular calcium-sensing receptor-like [Latimeria chalumnae]|eukprot:XP_014353601.1 PREDICTED: extracellular calcium-sensing receptor-like [Latimeria chalumnae]
MVEPDLSFEGNPHSQKGDGFNFRAFRWVQTMVFTIEQINRDPHLLPNITLGYKIYDSCSTPLQALRAAVIMVNGQEGNVTITGCTPSMPVVTGETGSTQSIAISRFLGLFSIPVVSYFSTCACLSDKREYPMFLRTVPSDLYQVKALVQLVRHFGWSWIGSIASDDDYGQYGIQFFNEEVTKLGACIAFTEFIPKVNYQAKVTQIVETIKMSKAKVILLFSVEHDVNILMQEVMYQNVLDKQWIASEAWVTSALISTRENLKILSGTIGFAIQRAEIPQLKEFLHNIHPSQVNENPFVTEFWGTLFNFGQFNGKTELGPKLTIYEDKIVWNSVHSKVPESVCSESCPPGTRKAILPAKPLCCFDCVPCADGEISNQTDSIECMICPPDFWSNVQKDFCLPKEVEYLSFMDSMGIVLLTVALLGTCLTFAITAVFARYRNTPIVKANNSKLSFLILFSLALCFLCSITFIGQPTMWSCKLRHVAFGIIFAFCISCILGKTIVVLMAFRANLPGNNVMRWFGPRQQRAIIIATTFIQIIISTVWMIIAPPLPVKNGKYLNSRIILECDVGSLVAFALVLSYIGLLSCICFVLAFLARNLPDSFNEAKYITFSMLIFFAVWISFIPAYISTAGKYTIAVEIFAILSSNFGLLLCLFAPKCYIILLKPEKNSKKSLMNRFTNEKKY